MRIRALRARLARIISETSVSPRSAPARTAAAGGVDRPDAHAAERLSSDVRHNVQRLQAVWDQDESLVVRRVEAGERSFTLVYLKGIVDTARLESDAVAPLVRHVRPMQELPLREIGRAVIANADQTELEMLDAAVDALGDGMAVLFAEGTNTALALDVSKWPQRSVELSPKEAVVVGPHASFTESTDTNLGLLRHRLRSPRFKTESFRLGRVGRTKVTIAYLRTIAQDDALRLLQERLGAIDIDAVLDAGYIAELIEDTPWTVFPTIWSSERPDAVAGQVLEGGIAILVDGSPNVLVGPATFWSFVHASEDYYQRFDAASIIRLIRVFSAALSVLVPALYAAVIHFNPEAISAPLTVHVASTLEAAPVSTFWEVLVVLLAFDILRESSVRLPMPIGPTIGIVGGLFVGQLSVQAGILTPTILIVGSLATITSFMVPHYSMGNAMRSLRYLALMFAGALGLYGLVVFVFIVLIHLAGLTSLGQPYFWPWRPSALTGPDTTVRVPWWRNRVRPSTARRGRRRRQPGPADDRQGDANPNSL